MANCCGEQAAASITAIAAAIAQNKSAEELALLSVAFCMIGDTIGVIAAQRALCEKNNDD
jgi:Na+/phosphate symporter